MLLLPQSVRIYLAAQPCDMRKGHDGLAALVKQLGYDAFDGHLFVFLSKRRDRCKILTWQGGGFVLWYKRFEKGRFKRPVVAAGADCAAIDAASLTMLLEGIDVKKVRRPPLWQPKKTTGDRLEDRDVIKDGYVDRGIRQAGSQFAGNHASAAASGG
jgi:transposase